MSLGIYLVKRGPRPDYYHAPFHPIIVCGKLRVAMAEAGWSGDAACVWEHARAEGTSGWLWHRWNGLDIDYGHNVRGFTLPDGSAMKAIVHDRNEEPWTIIRGAVWWDEKRPPRWLTEAGVVYPADSFSQESILRQLDFTHPNNLTHRPVPDIERPSFWPAAPPVEADARAEQATE